MDITYIYKLVNKEDCRNIEKYSKLAQVITRTVCQSFMLDLYGVTDLFKVNKKFTSENGMVLAKGDYCLIGEMSTHNADPQRGCRTNEEWEEIACEWDEIPDIVYEGKDNEYLEKVTDFEFFQFPPEPFGTNNFLTVYEVQYRSTINMERYSEDDFADSPDQLQVFRKFVACKKVEEIKSVENISGFVEFIVDKYEKKYGTVDPEISLVIGVIGRESFFWECGIWYHKGTDGTIVCAALQDFAPQSYSLKNHEPNFSEDSVLFQKSYELPENWAKKNAELENAIENAILALEEDSFDEDSDDDFDDELSAEEWADHLQEHPEDAEECDKWDEFDSRYWSYLLSKQPQFADKCDKWDEFDGRDWSWLLRDQPQFADKCDWSKLNDKNWEELLKAQPQFADKRK